MPPAPAAAYLVIQIFQQRHILRAGVCDIGAVHNPHGTVNDRLFHRLQTVTSACRQFTERQDKVGFQRQRVIVLAVIEDVYKRQLLEFGGCFFVCGSGRQPIQRDKTVNDNYYLLTLLYLIHI